MGIKKYLTCKTYLKALDEERIAARLDGHICMNVVTELGETYTTEGPFGVKVTHRLSPDGYYLTGEIAERLYEYEQLGYSPEELKTMLEARNAQRQIYEYLLKDVEATRKLSFHYDPSNIIGRVRSVEPKNDGLSAKVTLVDEMHSVKPYNRLTIKDVIFNDPATIVFWTDGTKTVVKAQDEEFDPEKGLTMAITKKFFGNKGNYFNKIKKWTGKYEAPKKLDIQKLLNSPCVTVTDDKDLPWKIWVEYYDDGEPYAYAVLPKEYKHKSSATRAAHRQFDYRPGITWTVSQTNPWTNETNN